MIFKRTKKYFIDCASLRLDSKIKIINEERKSRASTEYYWYTGQEKKINKKYKKLTNREISSSNSPLISLIRRGMVLDIYWLNEEQWIKVLTNKEIEVMLDSIPRNELVRYDAVYKISESNSTEYLKRFIGIISENSIIEKI